MAISESARKHRDFMLKANLKLLFEDADVFHGVLRDAADTCDNPAKIPADIADALSCEELLCTDGTRCLLLAPKNGELITDKLVVYYHGGGFLMKIDGIHWGCCKALVERLGCRVLVVFYGLLPKHDWRDGFSTLASAYKLAGSLCAFERLIIMGDSAGGYLALATQQLARAQELPLPGLVVAVSPMTDLSGQVDPALKLANQDADPLLALAGLQETTRLWAPDFQENPAFPPCLLEGPFDGLAPTVIMYGGDEILIPEGQEWARRAREAGTDVIVDIRPELWHIYAINLEIDEGREAFEKILARIEAF